MMTLEEFLSQWHDGADRLLVHTSGSTGEPKPLWVEKRRMEASARTTLSFLGLRAGQRALLCLPLDYIAGKMMVVRALVGHLRLVAVPPTGRPLRSLPPDAFEGRRLRLHFAAMTPTQVWNTLQVPAERELLRQIDHLIIGGGPVDDALVGQLRGFPRAVWSTYGMTETLSHIALRRLSGSEADDWYRPFGGVGVWLSDEGCLCISAPEVCPRPLVTRDVAELRGASGHDPHGACFRILGRLDNVVCSGGLKIHMEEVERRLRPHVDQPFLVTRRADERFGQVVVLLYVGTPRSEARLREVCRRVLPPYWQPRAYVAATRLPLTATGKPARREAEKMAAAALSPGQRQADVRDDADDSPHST